MMDIVLIAVAVEQLSLVATFTSESKAAESWTANTKAEKVLRSV